MASEQQGLPSLNAAERLGWISQQGADADKGRRLLSTLVVTVRHVSDSRSHSTGRPIFPARRFPSLGSMAAALEPPLAAAIGALDRRPVLAVELAADIPRARAIGAFNRRPVLAVALSIDIPRARAVGFLDRRTVLAVALAFDIPAT